MIVADNYTHMDAKNTQLEKKRGNTGAKKCKKGVWIATSLGSRLNNEINYTFTFNLHLYIIKKLQWLKWWHLPLKASSRYFGSEHSENFTGKTPATNLWRSKFKDFSVSAGDAAGESPFATTLPGFFRWEGGGKVSFPGFWANTDMTPPGDHVFGFTLRPIWCHSAIWFSDGKSRRQRLPGFIR